MKYTIQIQPQAMKDLQKYKKSNPNAAKKLAKLFLELEEHPASGTGHPEALKGGKGITYSRHITAHDRLIYNILIDTVVVDILAIEGHYNDK